MSEVGLSWNNLSVYDVSQVMWPVGTFYLKLGFLDDKLYSFFLLSPRRRGWLDLFFLPRRRGWTRSSFSLDEALCSFAYGNIAMVTDVPSISPPAVISLCFVAILYGGLYCAMIVGSRLMWPHSKACTLSFFLRPYMFFCKPHSV
jgi:hypothetical protein